MDMYGRNNLSDIKNALADSPVVVINGARQVGKSTLAKLLMEVAHPLLFDDIPSVDLLGSFDTPHYITLDDPTALAAAASSPSSFIESLPPHVVIDEIQRAPELFLAIKKSVDENRRPGRFLLTGSANVMTLPKLADSLAGRMEIHTLWPLSQGEIGGKKEGFVDWCFGNKQAPNVPSVSWNDIAVRIAAGGYPEAFARTDAKRRRAWFDSYISAILERDIRGLANIEGHRELPDLMRLLAARAGGMLNASDLARTTGLRLTTLKRYLSLLEAVFLYVPLPAWFKNEEKRLAKSPKVFMNDTGLLAYLRGMDAARIAQDRKAAGGMLENFVMMELRKQRGWSDTMPGIYHFRTLTGDEVDIVLEAPDGRIVGIEVKAASEVIQSDLKGMRKLMDEAGDRFHRGIILYTGQKNIHFADNILALPLSALWHIV